MRSRSSSRRRRRRRLAVGRPLACPAENVLDGVAEALAVDPVGIRRGRLPEHHAAELIGVLALEVVDDLGHLFRLEVELGLVDGALAGRQPEHDLGLGVRRRLDDADPVVKGELAAPVDVVARRAAGSVEELDPHKVEPGLGDDVRQLRVGEHALRGRGDVVLLGRVLLVVLPETGDQGRVAARTVVLDVKVEPVDDGVPERTRPGVRRLSRSEGAPQKVGEPRARLVAADLVRSRRRTPEGQQYLFAEGLALGNVLGDGGASARELRLDALGGLVEAGPAGTAKVGPGVAAGALLGKDVQEAERNDVGRRLFAQLCEPCLVWTLALEAHERETSTGTWRGGTYPVDGHVVARRRIKGGGRADDGQQSR